jgi:hypothetical protein
MRDNAGNLCWRFLRARNTGCLRDERCFADAPKKFWSIFPVGRTTFHKNGLTNGMPIRCVRKQFINVVTHRGLGPEVVMRVDDIARWIHGRLRCLLEPFIIIEHGPSRCCVSMVKDYRDHDGL